MKMRMICLLFILLIPGNLFAYDQADFDRIVDFSLTLKELNRLPAAEIPAFLAGGKLLLLNGTVAGVSFIDNSEENFQVAVELVSGEWLGLEDVRSYRCTVLFRGSRFFPLFPSRAPRNPEQDFVSANDRILVAASALDKISTDGGEVIWLLEGLHVRRLR
jgi:hypothetical protein